MNSTAPLTLRELDDINVEQLKDVGPRRAAALASIGINSVFDLLTHYPFRHVDRTREELIADTTPDDEVTVTGEVTNVSSHRFGPGGRQIRVEALLADPSGTLKAVFFNQPWRVKQLSTGSQVALFGKVEIFRNRLQMVNPVVDLIGDLTGVMVPIYPQSPKARITTWELAAWISEALRRCENRGIADPLPAENRQRLAMLERHAAFKGFHNPEAFEEIKPARTRLVFDELLRVQLMLRRDRLARDAKELGIVHAVSAEGSGSAEGTGDDHADGSNNDYDLWNRFTDLLSFRLTGAQQKVITEIEADLIQARPMHRLLQGDVGSGKTIVAARVLLAAVANRRQGALMVPTEVLAEQHFLSLKRLLSDLEVTNSAALSGKSPLRVALLVGSMTQRAHRATKDRLRKGQIDIVVGTHTLIQENVAFKDLSAVVVDEQHRFGVEQRSRLREFGRTDGRIPHMLVMTATPIPRTAAMTIYGDLDVSRLDEMPAGRKPIETHQVHTPLDQELMWNHVRSQVDEGHQIFVVCPLIEESESTQARSAQTTFEELCASELEGLEVGLLHGRMKSAEKEQTMAAFHRGRIDVLVSTTVVEVGVDEPNATVMVILSANRFGMAQLHQLRGRVGRGYYASHCYLVVEEDATEVAQRRLDCLTSTTDGFKLAEEDLRLRGEGTLFAASQSGRSDLKLASLLEDKELVKEARSEAARLITEAGDLTAKPSLAALADEIDWFTQNRDEINAEFLQKD